MLIFLEKLIFYNKLFVKNFRWFYFWICFCLKLKWFVSNVVYVFDFYFVSFIWYEVIKWDGSYKIDNKLCFEIMDSNFFW